jgi:hypothetical protein
MFLTASDSSLQIPLDVEQRIAPLKMKSAICFATELFHRASNLHQEQQQHNL